MVFRVLCGSVLCGNGIGFVEVRIRRFGVILVVSLVWSGGGEARGFGVAVMVLKVLWW
ncbi:hypothetical protein L195_g033794 [Trifolium pratense]|uniref:Uncharacterized protein n=1 Tax=Trifolium pratense TaxID=57577 RepID=A0A2K3LH31_TRIPR|nr:hypothetical protein L195_g033794 [Trifolium pratense]